ncbi:MAG: MarC family transcriptional regulator [Candidatus Altiarchaeales archaeon HGW-Altiarchaeales-3]|nr:MAG: MarC family transcriptional regulator [Candidatus Altiarchaeales archaeon HGW-Altiarchaeales-3]
MDHATFFIYAFVSIFIIVNPIAGLITFISLTSNLSSKERKVIVKRSVTIACALALIFAISGELVLRLFNITVDSLRVAGGVLLFMIALDMLHARVSRESVTIEEMTDATKREDISVFPLAMPLLTGPGAITTVIIVIRTGETIDLKVLAILAIILTFALVYLIFAFADKINKILGVTGSLVLTRVMGLILGAIAVSFVSTGAWNIYRAMI